jgi:uncharacterized protein YbjT (DUF2867 family)
VKENAVIVVTGATGIVGRPLIEQLCARGLPVRAVVHRAGRESLPAGVDTVECDLSEPQGLAHALKGAAALFVHPRAVSTAAPALLELAAKQGVQRVVALSAINVDDDLAHQPSRLNGDRNKEVEDAVARSGLPWVSVRAGSFAFSISSVWAPKSVVAQTLCAGRTAILPKRSSMNTIWPPLSPRHCVIAEWLGGSRSPGRRR